MDEIREPEQSDLPSGVSAEEYTEQFLGEHSVEIHWRDVDQNIFESFPNSGTSTLTFDIREDDAGLFIVDRTKVGDPSARLACADSMVLSTTMTVSSSDSSFSGDTEVAADIVGDSLNWTMELIDSEIVDQFQVDFFRPEAWDDKQIRLRLSLVEGTLQAKVFVVVYAGSERYSYIIGEG